MSEKDIYDFVYDKYKTMVKNDDVDKVKTLKKPSKKKSLFKKIFS